ncbi:MAG: single-stranded DNA-binding protein [Bacilli bacterium]|nr:single-stranded DNA-binding protein [Bacilli bacterium]MBP3920121.1 single-stranded DNA-binding protein [Bacilli bacterium]
MLNQTLLIGRIVAEPELRETSTGKKVSSVRLAIPKPYRNEAGVYETDYIECTMWNNKAERASDHLKTGDLVLVSARIQTYTNEKTNQKSLELVAENISFLSKSKKAIEQELSQEDIEPEMDFE